MAMNHKRSFCAQQLKCMGKHFSEFGCINPQKLAVCASRICKWTQHVKDTPQSHFFSRFCSKSHGAVIQRSKKKTDTDVLNRFFHSCEFLMATTGWRRDRVPSRLQQWRKEFHLNEVASAPQKLASWAGALPSAALGSTAPAQVRELVTSLQAVSDRMKTLMQARAAHQSDAIVRELREDVHSWRVSVQAIFARLASEPDAAEFADYRSRLDAKLERLEARIAEALDRTGPRGLTTEEGENMYRLLGAHRGLSEALVGLAKQTAAIDWPRLREARF